MTQAEEILQHLLTGKPITPIDALKKYGCFRLASRINDLRKAGHEIKTTMVTNEYGKTFASYSMEITKVVNDQYEMYLN